MPATGVVRQSFGPFEHVARQVTKILAAATLIGTAAVSPATAGHSASSSATASVEVINPISISSTSDLRFGTIVPTGAAGTVKIDPNGGARTPTNVDTVGAGYGAATFQVNGEYLAAFSITLPTSISLTGPGPAMLVELFSSLPSGSGTINVLISETAGFTFFNVGATLNVAASQLPGTYSKSFSVTVAYQ